MSLERKIGQWSCKVSPNKPIVFQVSGHDIVVTNVSLGGELCGNARSSLVIYHGNADELTQEATVACLTPGKAIHLALNQGQRIALAVRGDNEIHLFGDYVAFITPVIMTYVVLIQSATIDGRISLAPMASGPNSSSATAKLPTRLKPGYVIGRAGPDSADPSYIACQRIFLPSANFKGIPYHNGPSKQHFYFVSNAGPFKVYTDSNGVRKFGRKLHVKPPFPAGIEVISCKTAAEVSTTLHAESDAYPQTQREFACSPRGDIVWEVGALSTGALEEEADELEQRLGCRRRRCGWRRRRRRALVPFPNGEAYCDAKAAEQVVNDRDLGGFVKILTSLRRLKTDPASPLWFVMPNGDLYMDAGRAEAVARQRGYKKVTITRGLKAAGELHTPSTSASSSCLLVAPPASSSSRPRHPLPPPPRLVSAALLFLALALLLVSSRPAQFSFSFAASRAVLNPVLDGPPPLNLHHHPIGVLLRLLFDAPLLTSNHHYPIGVLLWLLFDAPLLTSNHHHPARVLLWLRFLTRFALITRKSMSAAIDAAMDAAVAAILASNQAGWQRGGLYAFEIPPTQPQPLPMNRRARRAAARNAQRTRQPEIKIGRSNRPPRRKREWMRQCRPQQQEWWFYWDVPDARQFEHLIHLHFKLHGAWIWPEDCEFCGRMSEAPTKPLPPCTPATPAGTKIWKAASDFPPPGVNAGHDALTRATHAETLVTP
ncbi:hypothetical protein B0H17DRAFT_1217359 [Mycena rosella]|uniref:Uncharacterized protein n=1 Tax=Mycena rosella TaxID=1033263 RepID=A0AAD7BZN9_MYCRO|nr:hypothetical protein B0H17DRAFT_1217359 [Mycena rosella]